MKTPRRPRILAAACAAAMAMFCGHIAAAVTLRTVALSGQLAPGTASGVNYDLFSVPALNAAGQTAFGALITGSGVNSGNDRGIWSEGSGTLELVARTGSQAPGTSSGVNFYSFDSPSLNAAGQTSFYAYLTGSGVLGANDQGIWATDVNGLLQLIVRTGDQLEVAPGDFRTVGELFFLADTSGNEDGRLSSFNDLGQVAFVAAFVDGSEGVFVSNRVAIPDGLVGDFNNDGTVNAADYTVFRDTLGSTTNLVADGNGNSIVDTGDYDVWRQNLGDTASGSVFDFDKAPSAVPEPNSIVLLGLVLLSRGLTTFQRTARDPIRNRTGLPHRGQAPL